MKRYKWLIAEAIILVLPILLVGCVSKSTYGALQEEHAILQANYEALQEENSSLQADYDILLKGKTTLESEIKSLQKQFKDLENTINRYKNTYGTVYSEIQPPYSKALFSPINLINNREASNPSWEQLKIFLGTDETDQDAYLVNYQMCGYFAEKLHNNAEKAGIRSAFVALDLGAGSSHTLNAFKTTDFGLVFIDSTGREIYAIPVGWNPPTNPSWDKLVTVRIGQEIVSKNLFPERATYTSWPTYLPQKWEVEWESIGTVYNIEVYW